MLSGVEIVNTLTSAAACTATRGKRQHSPFQRPLGRGEWGGCETGPFPSFSRRGGCAAPLIRRSRSLAAQTGWFVISNKIRRLRDSLLTTPAAARPPLL